MPRDSRIAAREAAAIPFPREETTPPDTNTYFVIYERGARMVNDIPKAWMQQTMRGVAPAGLRYGPGRPTMPGGLDESDA